MMTFCQYNGFVTLIRKDYASLGSYYIKTFGCQMNEHDSEVLAGVLEEMGYDPVAESEKADIILLNTCCVRETAENKVFSFLGRLRAQKAKNPELIIAICGCMPQQKGMASRIRHLFPHVDLVFGTHNLHRLEEHIVKITGKREPVTEIWPVPRGIAEGLPVKRKAGISAWVTIMYGCDNYCTYCIVPYVRGRERSRNPDDIIAEVTRLGENGFKEVVLLGQNVNSYGKDLDERSDFSGLLKRLENINGILRIRYMTSHPRDFNDTLIQTIASSGKVCEQFHLPVQAGSNQILKRMNRGYTREEYLRLINNIKKLLPRSTVTTDIMVGFPNETEEDFEQTLDLVRQVRFDSAFTFVYNNRPGTPASEMAGHVPGEVKKRRIQTLIKLQNDISLEKNREAVGQIEEILVAGERMKNERFLCGRNRGGKMVVFPGEQGLIGHIVPVTINSAHLTYLVGCRA